jgi:hypothetical protein
MQTDVLVVGGGFGGCAAALALVENGCQVVMAEPYPWIGGQVTSQALCALDEFSGPGGETVGFNRSYFRFRNLVRDFYRQHYRLSERARNTLYLNPGNTLVSSLSAEPRAALWALERLLHKAKENGQLTILTSVVPVAAERKDGRLTSVRFTSVGPDSAEWTVHASFVLEATEMGDLYPLAGIPFRQGAESKAETGEAHALDAADSEAIQGITYCIVVEFDPQGRHTIARPDRYETVRDRQGFALLPSESGNFLKATGDAGQPFRRPFWGYRRLVDAQNFDDPTMRNDIAVINVPSNDYHDRHLLTAVPQERDEVLAEARHLSLCYLYWLQTEAPRDEGGHGYPELKPRPDLTGASDGLAMAPYIREGRRLQALFTIREEDVLYQDGDPVRAASYVDSVGLGCYYLDLHQSTHDRPGLWLRSRPYQIPLGALLAPSCPNLIAAGKNIGVTHVTNGCYRLHPQEWAIGEAAGLLAAFCLKHGKKPSEVREQASWLRCYQRELLARGVPLYWFTDVPDYSPAFPEIQLLATAGIWPGHPDSLRAEPDLPAGSPTENREPWTFAAAWRRLAAIGIDVDDIQFAVGWHHGTRRSDAAYQLGRRLEAYDLQHAS